MIVSLQCLLLYGSLKFMHYAGLMSVPGWAIPQIVIVLITAGVGIALGLFISAIVKTSEMATSMVPLILIPQILFSGLVGVPQNTARVISTVMPATWAFDGVKRFSTLDTLDEEGSDPDGENKGRGLYQHVKTSTTRTSQTRAPTSTITRSTAKDKLKDYEKEMKDYIAGMQRGVSRTSRRCRNSTRRPRSRPPKRYRKT